ncbi:hypothetical protein ACA086_07675 [Muriicola sp. E247]|uniref:hypothetical protein n=1 Tax=Muriicola sp. E247 TaxID=3242730 RepID=UPI0035238E15
MRSIYKIHNLKINTLCLLIISAMTLLVSCSKEETCDISTTLTIKNNESFYPLYVYFIEESSDTSGIVENDLPPDYIIPSRRSENIILPPGVYMLYTFVYERERCSRCQDKQHDNTISQYEVTKCENTLLEFPDLDLDRN